ncbi:MAG: NFACT RNA binding domain-containing protein [Candidatus Woesearchaeota archaeon]
MKINLDLTKSLEENAALYFEKAKKSRKKIEGIDKAISLANSKLKEVPRKKAFVKKVDSKKHWYERFRWCFSSEGFLLVGGKDAPTNEEVIKKHAEKGDVVLHTDMAGSPFVVIKSEGKDIPDLTKAEAAQFVAAFSRAWKKGLGSIEVFWVLPDQVTKQANAGESLPTGAFMIRGKTNYVSSNMDYAVGILEDGRVMGGPLRSVKKHCSKFVKIRQANGKTSDVAKQIRKQIGGDLDSIVRALPAGCEVAR